MLKVSSFFMSLFLLASSAFADENLFGYVKGAETIPQGGWEVYEILTHRNDKGTGSYQALDSLTEIEYGVTDRFNLGFGVKAMSVKSSDILIDAYIPKDIDRGLSLSGFELSTKYNFLSPAKDDIGVSTYFSIDYSSLDPHSGQGKDTTSAELMLLVQKYFLEGEIVWANNLGLESTYAHRHHVEGLQPDFEWPTHPEMEIEIKVGTGLTYRFIPRWFAGVEAIYETEYETEVGQERYSTFAGPSVHYGSEAWWFTLTYFKQLDGGGPPYPDQENTKLHLIEKTKQEARLKVGFNF